jgi:hypothetical protein
MQKSLSLLLTLKIFSCQPPHASEPCRSVAGDLLVTEILVDPGKDGSEWIEIYNPTSVVQSLSRVRLEAGSTTLRMHAIAGPYELAPGAYFVLGPETSSMVNYSYGSALVFPNEEGQINLRCAEVLVDSVHYGGKAAAQVIGMQSLQRESLAEAVWCNALPTPGQVNHACGVNFCEQDGTTRSLVKPQSGDLLLTEVFSDPKGVDHNQEWLEVTALKSVDLNGVVIKQRTTKNIENTWQLHSSTCLHADAHEALLVQFTDVDDGLLVHGKALTNGASTFEIWYENTLIDTASIPAVPVGHAANFDAALPLEAQANDAAESFCAATTSFADESFGTPGAANIPCKTVCEGDKPGPGEVQITEIFADPEGADDNRDWLEITVAKGSGSVNLADLQIVNTNARASKRSWILPDCLTVQRGTRLIIAGANASLNGAPAQTLLKGPTATLLYNEAATLELILDGEPLDNLGYPKPTSGKSYARDDLGQWCVGKETPGIANDPCS